MTNTARTVVNCSVSNCNYWGESNVCRAESIIIEIDKHSGNRIKEEYAEEMTFSDHRDVANNSSATCCLTFKPKA